MRKYQRIEEWVKERLREGKLAPGDKLPSETELCGQFGVGRNSVRAALLNLAHAGYVETKKGIGTFCLAATPELAMNIGFVCFYANSYIFPRIIDGCVEVLFRNGYHLLLNQSENNPQKEREILTSLCRNGIDGLIIEPYFDGTNGSNQDLLEELDRGGTPVVLIDNHFPGAQFSSVTLDDEAGGELVAGYLFERGHREIAIAYDQRYAPKIRRRDGARSYLAARGVEVGAERLLGYDGPASNGRLYACALALLNGTTPRPTAFICTNDEESIEVMRAAAERGLRVPDDLSIISFDNSKLAEVPNVELTSIDHPGRYIGDLAATILLERIRFDQIPSRTSTVIRPTLVERKSVLDLRGGATEREQPAGHSRPDQ